MSRNRVVWLLARREVTERVRSTSFLVSAAVTLAVVVAIAVLPAVFGDDGPTTYDVGVVDDPALLEELPAVAGALDEDLAVDARAVDLDEGERLLRDGDLDAVVSGGEIVVHEDLGTELAIVLRAAAGDGTIGEQALGVRALDPPDQEEEDREAMVGIGTFLLYGQLMGFGVWVASGLVEEKSGRVAELLLTKARPGQVLAGKVLGIGFVGFVQLVATVAIGLGAAVAAGSIDLPPGTASAVAMVLAWFVLGFAFYSCLFAVGGALASRAEELQNTTAPITMVVIAAFFAAVAAGGDPGGTVARVTTFLPPSAPLVLPIRHAAGELALWELLGGAAVLLAATVVVVRLAARAYAGAALHVRGTMKLRDALARAGG